MANTATTLESIAFRMAIESMRQLCSAYRLWRDALTPEGHTKWLIEAQVQARSLEQCAQDTGDSGVRWAANEAQGVLKLMVP